MKKKISIAVISILFLLLGWYFGIKESDYTVSFKVKAASGTIFQGIQEWSKFQKTKKKESFTILEKNNFDYLKQQMTVADSSYIYTWKISSLNDSTSRVSVGIKDLKNSWYNKVTTPFFDTKFKEKQLQRVKEIRDELNAHIKEFKVRIDGEGESEEVFVAYIQLKSVLQEKAQTMIANDATITGFLFNNKIKITGKPYVEITDWNLDNETITFNYCFPVDKNTKMITDTNVKFKTIPAFKGLKATYNGNFRTSDRAWFALIDYAKKNDLKLKYTVLEHFLANPFNGGNELEWETKIIMPFDTK